MKETQTTLFVDTCIFLHFHPITQMKWREHTKAEHLTLAVCAQVIDDLDKFKHDSRLADRARRSLKDIESNEGQFIQPGVSLILTESLSRKDFPSEMDPEQTDNHIIRSAQLYREQHPQEAVMIVTEDTGMVLRARKAGVQVFRLPDSERLPTSTDELVRRVKKAEAELSEERSKRPDLELLVTMSDHTQDGPDSTEFCSAGNFQPVNVEEAMRNVRAQYPKIGSGCSVPDALALRFSAFRGCTPTQAEEYDERLERYFQSYERFLKGRNSWLQKRGIFFSFDLFVTNKGKALATNIQAEVSFPSFVRLVDPDTLSDPSDEFPLMRPRPPERPSYADILGHTPLLLSPVTSLLSRAAEDAKTPRVHLTNEGGPSIRASLAELIHDHTRKELRTITFWFRVGEQPHTFSADYSILSAELPKSLQKHLLFTI